MSEQQTNSNPKTDVVVIGGGVAGLAAAAYVARAGRTVTVLERSARLGGRGSTDERDGFMFNQGPHALYKGGAGAGVLKDLGVKLAGGSPATKGRVIFEGRPEIAPGGPITMLRTKALGLGSKVKLGMVLNSLPKLKPAEFANMSATEWVDSVLSEPRAQEMLHALLRLSNYSNNPDVLSAECAIGQLQFGLGEGVLYLDNGWQSLVTQLAATPGVSVQLESTVAELPDAPVVIVASGGPKLAEQLLGTTFEVGPPAMASCLDLGLLEAPTHNFVLGGDVPFYFSNHSAAAQLAPQGRWHVAALQYLGQDDEPDPTALRDFVRFAGVQDDHIALERKLHRMTAVSAIATAAGGGYAGRPTSDATGQSNVFLAGDWVGPVGHLADASLASARDASTMALAALEKLPSLR